MGLESEGGVQRRRRRRRRNFCICESIGHRPLWGRCPKRRGTRNWNQKIMKFQRPYRRLLKYFYSQTINQSNDLFFPHITYLIIQFQWQNDKRGGKIASFPSQVLLLMQQEWIERRLPAYLLTISAIYTISRYTSDTELKIVITTTVFAPINAPLHLTLPLFLPKYNRLDWWNFFLWT